MRQFDVIPMPARGGRRPLVVVLQHDNLVLPTVVVAPCVPKSVGPQTPRLTPSVKINGSAFSVMIHEMTSTPRSLLRQAPIANVRADRDAFTSALDYLFAGY